MKFVIFHMLAVAIGRGEKGRRRGGVDEGEEKEEEGWMWRGRGGGGIGGDGNCSLISKYTKNQVQWMNG